MQAVIDKPETQQEAKKKDIKYVPLDYAYYVIRNHLWDNWDKSKTERLEVVKKLLDENTTFGHIRKNERIPNEHDDKKVKDFFDSFYINRHYADAIMNKQSTYFFRILEEITRYLSYIRHKDKDSLTPEISSEYKEKQWKKYNIQVEEALINDKNTTLDDLERIHPDNAFKQNCSLQSFLKEIYYIPEKSKKPNVISWDKINESKYIEILHRYDQLPEYAKDLIDSIQYIEQLEIRNKQLNQLKKCLQIHLQEYYASLKGSPKQVGRSVNPKAERFQTNESVWADLIIEYFDFSNPEHIFGLIENYFDLWQKHKHNAGNPIYEVLQHFNTYIKNIQFSDKHKRILNTYMKRSSDRIVVAKLLNMDTDKMRKMTERTISKNIAHYFSENVVN